MDKSTSHAQSTSVVSLSILPSNHTDKAEYQQIGGQRDKCRNLCICTAFGRQCTDDLPRLSTISDKVSEVSRPARLKIDLNLSQASGEPLEKNSSPANFSGQLPLSFVVREPWHTGCA
jgi:hypothetical protein